MRPHIIPRVILKQFRIGSGDDNPVLLMDKSTKVFRERGINHPVFLGPSNYIGNGERGTLENEIACKDESSIRNIIDLIRNGVDMAEYLPELKFLLGNNSARNPQFRKHPKVSEHGALSSEEFHTIAMDIFPNDCMEHPVCIIGIKSNSNPLIFPDFSLTHMVLSPDIVIMRVKKDDQTELLKRAKDDESHFVTRLNQISYERSHSWVVSNSRKLLESFGGTAKRPTVNRR
jgi:hypothetical protein